MQTSFFLLLHYSISMSRSGQSARNRALLTTAAVVLAGAATAYFYFTSSLNKSNTDTSNAADTAPTTPQSIIKSKRNIAILVTQVSPSQILIVLYFFFTKF